MQASMSRGLLIYNESGRVVPTMCEELTVQRRARKRLTLPAGFEGPGTLYLHVRKYAEHPRPLHLRVNGHGFEYSVAEAQTYLHWAEVRIPAGVLRGGENIVELWSDSQSQNAWTLGMEGGHRDPGSFLSTDGGLTWQNERMGLYHVQRGEYLVRLRLPTVEEDCPPPAFTWENPSNQQLGEFRAIIPQEISDCRVAWRCARGLASWVSMQWRYRNASDQATAYTPWDPWTILAWNENVHAHGHVGRPIRMCMHYGVVFITACLASGIPARGVVGTSDLRGVNGHFVCEVWNGQFNDWSLIDPNLDVAFIDRGRPLGAVEVFDCGGKLRSMADTGPGTEFHRERLGPFLEEYLGGALMLRLTGVWPRNDFLSHPELAPACHGQEGYSETDIVWRDRHQQDNELGMFPYVAGDEYFSVPPPARWLAGSRFRGSRADEVRRDRV